LYDKRVHTKELQLSKVASSVKVERKPQWKTDMVTISSTRSPRILLVIFTVFFVTFQAVINHYYFPSHLNLGERQLLLQDAFYGNSGGRRSLSTNDEKFTESSRITINTTSSLSSSSSSSTDNSILIDGSGFSLRNRIDIQDPDPKTDQHQLLAHPHPHAGAKDEFHRWGYVHDPTIILQKPQPFVILPEEKDKICAEVGYGNEGGGKRAKMLFRKKIKVAEMINETSAVSSTTSSAVPKVFCAIYSYPGNNNQTDAIRRTWGGRCDGFMTASTETNHDLAAVNLPHFGNGNGQYNGIWQKVRSMIGYIYDNFLEDYDFYFICGDDTYLIMENLKELLMSPNFIEYAGGKDYPNIVYTGGLTHPQYLAEKHGKDFYYMGGGSGYLINRSTVRALVERVFPICHNETDRSKEDLYMGLCLRDVLNVTGYDSRDTEGRERFIGVDPIQRAAIRPRKRKESIFGEQHKIYLRSQFRWQRRNFGWKTIYGVGAISPKAISFHLVKPAAKMKRFERLFYRMSPKYSERDCNTSNVT
jgi:hypothetical protein